MNRLSLIVAAAIVGGAISSQAATLAYSGLAGQPAGALIAGVNGSNDGAGWSGTWDPQNDTAYNIATTTPLTFGALSTSADGNYITGRGNYTGIGRRLSTGNAGVFQSAGYVSDPYTLGNIDTGVLWFSVLARVSSATTDFYLQLNDSSIAWGDGTGISIGRNGTNWSAGLTAATYAAGTTPVTANQTVLLVGRYNFAGAASSFHFWAMSDPASAGLGGADLSLASANVALTGLANTAMDFKSFKGYLANDGANKGQIDEVRFGTDYASVTPIPEPTTFLAAAGLCGLLLSRKRM